MILNFKQLSHTSFVSGMKKLASCSDYQDPKTSYAVFKLVQLVEPELELKEQLRKELVKRTNPKETTLTPQEIEAEVDKFHGVEIEIDRPPLKLSEILPARLSALEIQALLPLIVED